MKFSGEVSKNSLIQEGEYEVTLHLDWDKTKAGDDYIKLDYTIRKDVEQNEQGKHVWDALYKSKTTGDFPENKINAILSTIPKNQVKLDFESYDDLIQYLNGLNMIIEVQTQKKDPTNVSSIDKSVVKLYSNKPTIAGPVFVDSTPIDITEEANKDEIPF